MAFSTKFCYNNEGVYLKMKTIHSKAYAQDVIAIFRSNYGDFFTDDNVFFTYNKDYFNQSLTYLLEDMNQRGSTVLKYIDRHGVPDMYAIDLQWDAFQINEENFLIMFEMLTKNLSNKGYSVESHQKAYNAMLRYGWKNGFIQSNKERMMEIMTQNIAKQMSDYKASAVKYPNDADYKPERYFYNILDTYNTIFFLCPEVLMYFFEEFPDLANANELRSWYLTYDDELRLNIVDVISAAEKTNPAFYKIASLLYTNNAVSQGTHAYETLFAAHVNNWPITAYGVIGNLGKKLGTAWLDAFLNSYFNKIQNLDKLLQDDAKAIESFGDKKHFYDSFLIENFKALKNIILEKNKRARNPNAFFVDMAFTIANRLHRFENDIYQTLVEPVFEKNNTAITIDANYCHGILNSHPHFSREFFMPYMLKGFEKDRDSKELYKINIWYKQYTELLPETLADIVNTWSTEEIETNQTTIGQWLVNSDENTIALMKGLVNKWVQDWDNSNLSFLAIHAYIKEYIIDECKKDPEMFRKIASTLCVEFFDFIDCDRETLMIPYEKYSVLPFSHIQNVFNAYKILPGFVEAWQQENDNFSVGKTFLGAILSSLGASLNTEKDFDGHGMVEIFIKNIQATDRIEKKKIFTQILSQNNIHVDESIDLIF